MLQWGRDVIVADGSSSPATFASPYSPAPLQWGRDVIVADGTAERDEIDVAVGVLQWGRDVIVADGIRPPSSRLRALSFNGAATLSSRMASRRQASK